MTNTPIVDNMDVFAEKFEGIDLHGKKITKAEFDDCTFVSCDFSETFFSCVGMFDLFSSMYSHSGDWE